MSLKKIVLLCTFIGLQILTFTAIASSANSGGMRSSRRASGDGEDPLGIRRGESIAGHGSSRISRGASEGENPAAASRMEHAIANGGGGALVRGRPRVDSDDDIPAAGVITDCLTRCTARLQAMAVGLHIWVRREETGRAVPALPAGGMGAAHAGRGLGSEEREAPDAIQIAITDLTRIVEEINEMNPGIRASLVTTSSSRVIDKVQVLLSTIEHLGMSMRSIPASRFKVDKCRRIQAELALFNITLKPFLETDPEDVTSGGAV